ncbi:glycosyl hydrolase family 20, catalytic domain protein [Streptomyces himastatinicus ATCC 53653]|uniref:Glycosyl hydrolase family 20, catalytic domain protein n=1 Tax=Streptomyces himastatinicus ATCC 53653 TaxID=457427 RepID=D9W9A5_9ACTN|nr:glycosyl hydrolase family 20, catalytic domain protein [Streptomyces himastatinicus ATCC 53653]
MDRPGGHAAAGRHGGGGRTEKKELRGAPLNKNRRRGRRDGAAAAGGDRRPTTQSGRCGAGGVCVAEEKRKKEGYELVVGDTVRITGATASGAFLGTRTVLQMLGDGRELPHGSTVDVPRYAERGVGVCACYIHVSLDWFERLMREMAYLKLNQLWIEAKVAGDDYPKTKFWGYYTKDEVRRLSAMARKYHITLVPEINSPGHIDPYLQNHPELQLTDTKGTRSPSRLDITRPEAFAFYTGLLDEALTVWDTPYWHMGADEYMLGSDYAAYPQIAAYAKAKYGARATPQDAFVDFVNRVDDHVRAGGRTLRIWNDGLTGDNTIPVNKDIRVEHWTAEPEQPPSALLAQGHQVMNSAYALYLIRGGSPMKTRELYESDWTPLRFEGETLSGPQPGITGAKITMWPDSAAAQTENEVETEAYLPLRFLAQATWGSPKPAATYDGFSTLARDIGHAPGWENVVRLPVKDGTYALTLSGSATRLTTSGGGEGATARFGEDTGAAWRLSATADGYYTLRAVRGGTATAYCLDMVKGARYLGAPLEAGATVTTQTCSATARTQRWQLTGTGTRVRLVNAISQLGLAQRAADGGAVQQPPDQQAAAELRPVAATVAPRGGR